MYIVHISLLEVCTYKDNVTKGNRVLASLICWKWNQVDSTRVAVESTKTEKEVRKTVRRVNDIKIRTTDI